MKTRKLIFAALLSVMAVCASSCLKDQADKFDQPSSARMQAYLENVRDILEYTTDEGWVLDYYPGSAYAGISIALKFTSQEVTAVSEKDPFEEETSTFKLTTDDGPVLSFDTYNSIIHEYATPSSTKYQAKGGDFEFDILKVSDEEIVLRGKRSRNYCFLHPLYESIEDYLYEVQEMERKISVAAVSTEIGGVEFEGYLDSATRTFSYGEKGTPDEDLINKRYVITPTGLRFAGEFSLGDEVFTEWVYDADNEEFIDEMSGTVFEKVIPKGWVSYNDYLGGWTLNYDGGHFDVTLTVAEQGNSFYLEGISKGAYKALITYNGGRGRLGWIRQGVGASGTKEIALCPWDAASGYYTWGEGIGMIGYVEDETVTPLEVKWMDNGVWRQTSDYTVNSWLCMILDSNNSDNNTGASGSYLFPNNSYQLPGPITFVKK